MTTLLLTGFEPYGGRDLNPSAEIVQQLHNETLTAADGTAATVIGHTLPVALDGLAQTVQQLLDEYRPLAVVCLGLAPGIATIRLERIAVNLADFGTPDNTGANYRDAAIADGAPPALFSTLPLRVISQRLLAAGVPAQLSNSAGTYLCNAVMYLFLHALRQNNNDQTPCGFIHVPYLPEQVAQQLDDADRTAESGQPANLSSMSLAMMVEGIRTALLTTLETKTT